MKELEKIIEKWRKEAREAVPPEYADRQMHGKYLRLDNHAAGMDDCADELEALLPALEKALEKRDEVMLNQGAIAATNSIVTKQEAEIAALREVMNCGHPRACWQAVKPDSVDAVVGYRCIACEHERLAVAILLKSFYEFLPPELLESAAKKFGQYDGRALDAHDAAIRERTLQEVFSRWDQEGEQDTWNWLCETLDEEKGGSK